MKIIMLGESLERQGGIVSVEKHILQEALTNTFFRHIVTLPKGSFVKKILVFWAAIAELLWRLLRRESDLVHIHVSERGSAYRHMITGFICFVFRQPFIIHAHSADFHEFYPNLPVVVQKLMSWVFGKSSRFIVLSDKWKNFYIHNLGLKAEQVFVLPNPVKIPLQVPQRSISHQVRFVFLGRIGQRKGAFDLIEAFACLPQEYKNCTSLTLAGDGDLEKARHLVENFQLVDQIQILDWLNQEQRDALLAKADVFVLPSYNEGFPMALIEAMSWGLATITTPVGGIPEIINHSKNGLLVTPGNIQQLSDTIKFLIDNNDVRLALGSHARASVVHLDVNKYMNSLINTYYQVIASQQERKFVFTLQLKSVKLKIKMNQ